MPLALLMRRMVVGTNSSIAPVRFRTESQRRYDKQGALRRMAAAVRPGGALLIEEPDWITIY